MIISPFDEKANDYDMWYEENREILSLEVEAIRRMDLRGKGLDVGGGTGLISSKIGAAVCLDLSAPMLRHALRYRLHVVQGLAECLPFIDRSFDFVIMSTTLCFLSNPENAVKEAHRVLREDGILCACIIPRDSSWGRYYIKKAREPGSIFQYTRFMTVREVVDLLDRTSFHVEKICSTLHFSPGDRVIEDDVKMEDERGGFVCIGARK